VKLVLCRARALLSVTAIAACLSAATPARSSASICGAVGWLSGVAGKACNVASHGDKLISAGKKLATGHVGGAVKTALGGGGSTASTAIGLAAVVAWVTVGAKGALQETAKVIGRTTSPQLRSTWFSSTYWRVGGIAAVLTMPFLFAAAIQALMRSDLALLVRSALGYLPLSLLAVSIAAPLTMLLLAASDEMSAIVSSAGRNGGARFLGQLGLEWGTASVISRLPFLVFLIGLLTAAGAIVLWIEMVMREAAIYIVVLMLPLAFAAMVWPARRVWAIRAAELLVALILSKFAIVAVLALGGAALGEQGAGGPGAMVTGLVLVLLASFAPWALMRLLPLAELAGGAAGQLRGELSRLRGTRAEMGDVADRATDWAGSLTAGMRRQAREASSGSTNAADAGAGVAQLGTPASSGAEASGDGGGAEGESAADDDRRADGDPGAPAGPDSPGGDSPAPGSLDGPDHVQPERDPAPDAAPALTAPPPPRQPSPLPSTISAPDLSWKALQLGPHDGPLRQSLGPGDPDDEQTDDHDPRPASQPPENGRL
jgi:type IV secretion system protein TrbL